MERNVSGSGDEFLGDRRRALEEAFFAKQNEALLQRLRSSETTRQAQEALARATGLTDAAALERLSALGITDATLAALALAPLAIIAWADGHIEDGERREAVAKAAEAGLAREDLARPLFEQWLAAPPPPALLAAWKEYVAVLAAKVDHDARRALKRQVLERARAVAEARGGFLGLGHRLSPAEERMLNELGSAIPD